MKFALAIVLVLSLGVACTSQEPVCKNGNCPIVAVPSASEPVCVNGQCPVSSAVRTTGQSVAAAPAKVVKRVQVRRPVRSFFRRIFR